MSPDVFVPMDVLSTRKFYPTDVLSLDVFPTDVLSAGRFVSLDVLSQYFMSPDVLSRHLATPPPPFGHCFLGGKYKNGDEDRGENMKENCKEER
jgi:hypothetical protein